MEASDKIYIDNFSCYAIEPRESDSIIAGEEVCYVRKDMVVDAIKLAYGKVSMNPFDCSDAFEELLNKVGYEIH